MSEAIEGMKAASLGQVLIRAARRFNELGLARVRARLGVPVRAAHLALFPHIDVGGTRATEVARRLGVSKQAVGPLVRDLVAWGMLERVPDPEDGRARLLRFGDRPGRTLADGLGVLMEIEDELIAELGSERLAALREDLRKLDEALGGVGGGP